MRAIVQHPRGWAAVIAIAMLGQTAAAQSVVVQTDGTVNVGYSQTTRDVIVIDPTADPGDIPNGSTDSFFTEIRPGITLQSGSPRVSWRTSYLFSGRVSLDSGAPSSRKANSNPANPSDPNQQSQTPTPSLTGGTPSYSNQATAALVAELTPLTVLTVSGTFAQGGTSFQLSQQPVDKAKPGVRAPGNPNTISATLAESLAWQAGRHLQVQHSLIGALSTPQDDLRQRNTSLTDTASIERLYERDTVGAELRANISRLSPLRKDLGRYTSYTNAILGRWNHDFTLRWNGLVTAGVEQLFLDTGNRPLAFLPAGGASVRYSAERVVGGVDFTHGTATNLQVGSVSVADQVTARGIILIDEFASRVLGFSAGFLHNEPISETAVQVAAGTGNAVQGDAAFTTAIARNLLLSVRYSLAYQYGQGTGIRADDAAEKFVLGPTLVHIFFVGVTASYSNTQQIKRPLPTRGQRVDGGDGQGFPVVPDDDHPADNTDRP